MIVTLVVPDEIHAAFGSIDPERPQRAMVLALKEWLSERTADQTDQIYGLLGEPD